MSLSADAFVETFSNPLISKLSIGIKESDFSIIKECSVIWPVPEGINNYGMKVVKIWVVYLYYLHCLYMLD